MHVTNVMFSPGDVWKSNNTEFQMQLSDWWVQHRGSCKASGNGQPLFAATWKWRRNIPLLLTRMLKHWGGWLVKLQTRCSCKRVYLHSVWVVVACSVSNSSYTFVQCSYRLVLIKPAFCLHQSSIFPYISLFWFCTSKWYSNLFHLKQKWGKMLCSPL